MQQTHKFTLKKCTTYIFKDLLTSQKILYKFNTTHNKILKQKEFQRIITTYYCRKLQALATADLC